MSTRMMVCLLVIYAAIAIASAIERKWYRCLYWIGAICIMVGVLGMGKGK